MKGIILAGGSGTRLWPLTSITSKQLLPVYDKPMIYYPLATLMNFGIKEILIISTPQDIPSITQLFNNGSHLGIKIEYAIQEEPKGIAQALIIAEQFIKNSPSCLILGDNIFHLEDGISSNNFIPNTATIFAYKVSNPKRFGVIEFDNNHTVLSVEEKPQQPRSNYASVGLYFFPEDAASKAKEVTPSARGELEITDVINLYLQENRLHATPLERGNAWLDAGTPESLIDSANFIHIIEKRQGRKIGCIEETAWQQNFISDEQFKALITNKTKGEYQQYLNRVLAEKRCEYEVC